jgi:hypothetical protein
VELDVSRWSGEGTFTQRLIDALQGVDHISCLRVEDAPSTRSDVEYNFISNEVFVGFDVGGRVERVRRFGFWPSARTVAEKRMTMTHLELYLTGLETIGPPDYSDEGMLQYLRTDRIVPPYQTRGYKLVELVRVYEVGVQPRRP